MSISKTNGSFKILKSSENLKSRSLNRVRSENLLGKIICKSVKKIKHNRFFYGMFYNQRFVNIYQKKPKFGFCVAHCLIIIKSKDLRDFLEIYLFPKIISFKLFSNWGSNWHIHLLAIIIYKEFINVLFDLCFPKIH